MIIFYIFIHFFSVELDLFSYWFMFAFFYFNIYLHHLYSFLDFIFIYQILSFFIKCGPEFIFVLYFSL